MENKRIIQERNIGLAFFLSIITFGIYYLIWLYKTKEDINALGGNIPTFVLKFIPIVNLYFNYRYANDFVEQVLSEKKPAYKLLYFLCMTFFGFITLIFIQQELNTIAQQYTKSE